jgi:hypothetical protein
MEQMVENHRFCRFLSGGDRVEMVGIVMGYPARIDIGILGCFVVDSDREGRGIVGEL